MTEQDPRRNIRMGYATRLVDIFKLRGEEQTKAVTALYNDLHGFAQFELENDPRKGLTKLQGLEDFSAAMKIAKEELSVSDKVYEWLFYLKIQLRTMADSDIRLTGLGILPSDEWP